MNQLEKFLKRIRGKKILIQGLGLNGGGVGTALFFLKLGIPVTITDLKTSDILAKSIRELEPYRNLITYRLGEHRESDFIESDMIIKGPGVPPSNRFIQLAMQNGREISSDISIFCEITEMPVYAVTGSKGKSSTVSAIYHIFKEETCDSFLGGNITISPLTFYEELTPESRVILELSSWQLRDLTGADFHFKGTAITNLMQDHQNYYKGMEDYLEDKKIITLHQSAEDFLILPAHDTWLNTKNIQTDASIYYYSSTGTDADIYMENGSGFIRRENKIIRLFDRNELSVRGDHTVSNVLLASAFAFLSGINPELIRKSVTTFKGAPFRLELIREWNGIRFFNDTTATIPDAAVMAVRSFPGEKLIWIAGGNDKNCDFSVVKEIAGIPEKIFLLKGDGTARMKSMLGRNDLIEGDSLPELLEQAVKNAAPGTVILLSPGCTSFGLFQNEFHRGEVFNEWVRNLS